MIKSDWLTNIVYKYRSWNEPYHRRLLTCNEVYFSSPRDFDDLFDCKITPQFSNMTELEYRLYVNEYAKNNKMSFEEAFSNFKDVDKIQERYSNNYERVINDDYGVLCLSKNWDNPLLWSNYANKYKGFCIGINEDKLVGLIKVSFRGNVDYTDCIPPLKPISSYNFDLNKKEELERQAIIRIRTKSPNWSCEKEYRIMKHLSDEHAKNNQRSTVVDKDAITEVVLGLKIESKDEEEILCICKNRGIPVYKIQKVVNSLRLDRYRIL